MATKQKTIIELDDNWQIERDSHSWALSKVRNQPAVTRGSERRWEMVEWHRTLNGCLESYLNKAPAIPAHQALTVSEAVTLWRRCLDELHEIANKMLEATNV